MQQDYTAGQVSFSELVQRLQSWEAHLLHGDTYRLRCQIYDRWSFTPPPELPTLEIPTSLEPDWEF